MLHAPWRRSIGAVCGTPERCAGESDTRWTTPTLIFLPFTFLLFRGARMTGRVAGHPH